MTSYHKLNNIFFLILLSITPISIIVGPAVSLIITLLLGLNFILIYFKKNFFYLFKDRTLLILMTLYVYLIFNSFISTDFDIGFKRNFGFVRYIILFLAINYFIKNSNYLNIILKIWILIFSILLFDIFYEFYNGQNILGFISENKKRIVSFFKDEQVVGAFLNGFIFIIIGFLFQKFEKKKNYEKFLIILFVAFTIIGIILTGERSNSIKLFLGLMIFFYLNDKIMLKHKIFFIISLLSLFIIIFNFFFSNHQRNHLKHRYYNDLVQRVIIKEKRENILYFQLYNTAYEIFKENPYFGVGNKNYRIVTCKKGIDYVCNTHPHQIYFEFLSEHGLVGTLIILSILFYLIFKNYQKMLIKKNLIQIGCFCYLLINFLPLLPSGSFFADFNATFFWLNFSIYYAINSETNIFKKK